MPRAVVWAVCSAVTSWTMCDTIWRCGVKTFADKRFSLQKLAAKDGRSATWPNGTFSGKPWWPHFFALFRFTPIRQNCKHMHLAHHILIFKIKRSTPRRPMFRQQDRPLLATPHGCNSNIFTRLYFSAKTVPHPSPNPRFFIPKRIFPSRKHNKSKKNSWRGWFHGLACDHFFDVRLMVRKKICMRLNVINNFWQRRPNILASDLFQFLWPTLSHQHHRV